MDISLLRAGIFSEFLFIHDTNDIAKYPLHFLNLMKGPLHVISIQRFVD